MRSIEVIPQQHHTQHLPLTPIAAIEVTVPHMGASKKSRMSRYLPRASGSASQQNVAQGPPTSPASNPRLEQSPGEQKSQQEGLLQPTMDRDRRSGFIDRFKSRFRSRSPSPAVDHHITKPVSPSTSIPDTIDPSPHSAVVWDKTLDIAQKKLGEMDLPLLDLTNLTSQSAEENIQTVFKALNTIQEDKKEERWSYNWFGKETVIVEHLGKILKTLDKYLKVVDTMIQHNLEVTSLVWGAVRAIMQVCI